MELSQEEQVNAILKSVRSIFQCSNCSNSLTSPSQLGCGHIFCVDCLKAINRKSVCPVCNSKVTFKGVKLRHDLSQLQLAVKHLEAKVKEDIKMMNLKKQQSSQSFGCAETQDWSGPQVVKNQKLNNSLSSANFVEDVWDVSPLGSQKAVDFPSPMAKVPNRRNSIGCRSSSPDFVTCTKFDSSLGKNLEKEDANDADESANLPDLTQYHPQNLENRTDYDLEIAQIDDEIANPPDLSQYQHYQPKNGQRNNEPENKKIGNILETSKIDFKNKKMSKFIQNQKSNDDTPMEIENQPNFPKSQFENLENHISNDAIVEISTLPDLSQTKALDLKIYQKISPQCAPKVYQTAFKFVLPLDLSLRKRNLPNICVQDQLDNKETATNIEQKFEKEANNHKTKRLKPCPQSSLNNDPVECKVNELCKSNSILANSNSSQKTHSASIDLNEEEKGTDTFHQEEFIEKITHKKDLTPAQKSPRKQDKLKIENILNTEDDPDEITSSSSTKPSPQTSQQNDKLKFNELAESKTIVENVNSLQKARAFPEVQSDNDEEEEEVDFVPSTPIPIEEENFEVDEKEEAKLSPIKNPMEEDNLNTRSTFASPLPSQMNLSMFSNNISQDNNPLPKESQKNVKITESQPKKLVFCPSRLNRAELAKLDELCNICEGQGEISRDYVEEVTHLIIKLERGRVPQTMKYLFAIADKKWIVIYDWVVDCVTQGEILPEEMYETSSFPECDSGVRRSRLNPSQLLAGVCIYFPTLLKSSGATMEECKKLVMKMGGSVINSPAEIGPDQSILIIGEGINNRHLYQEFYKSKGWLSISWSWILDCLLSYRIIPFTKTHFLTKVDGESQISLPKPLIGVNQFSPHFNLNDNRKQ